MSIHRKNGLPTDEAEGLLSELRDSVRELRNFTGGGIAMQHAFFRGTHERRFGLSHRHERRRAIASADRLLDAAYRGPDARAPRLVDHGATGNLTSGLLGGFCIGHDVVNASCERAALIGARRAGVNAVGDGAKGRAQALSPLGGPANKDERDRLRQPIVGLCRPQSSDAALSKRGRDPAGRARQTARGRHRAQQ